MKNGILHAIRKNQQQASVLVIGDIILDEFVEGRVSRISPEGPFPILEYDNSVYHLGGAANVAANLSSLGAKVELIGVLGEDSWQREVVAMLKQYQIVHQNIYISSIRPTTVKTRFGAKGHQILRVDREVKSPLDHDWAKWVKDRISELRPNAVVVSDYGKGTITPKEIPNMITQFCEEAGINCYVDTKRNNVSAFQGATLLKPNKYELDEVTNGYECETLEEKIIKYRELANCSVVMASLGEQGLMIYNGSEFFYSSAQAKSVYDVTGAGDTVLAATVIAQLLGLGWKETAVFANMAASIAVSRYGTTTVSLEEMSNHE